MAQPVTKQEKASSPSPQLSVKIRLSVWFVLLRLTYMAGGLEEKQTQLSLRLGGLNEELESEEEKQLQVFASDIEAFVNTTGIQKTVFKQGELAGKLKALTASSRQVHQLNGVVFFLLCFLPEDTAFRFCLLGYRPASETGIAREPVLVWSVMLCLGCRLLEAPQCPRRQLHADREH